MERRGLHWDYPDDIHTTGKGSAAAAASGATGIVSPRVEEGCLEYIASNK